MARSRAISVSAALAIAIGTLVTPDGSMNIAKAQGTAICAGDGVYRNCNGSCKSSQCLADEERSRREAEQRPSAPSATEDSAAVRDLNAGLARAAHEKNAAFEKAQADYRMALAQRQAEIAAVNARNAARMAEHAQQKAAADAAQAAYEAQIKALRRR